MNDNTNKHVCETVVLNIIPLLAAIILLIIFNKITNNQIVIMFIILIVLFTPILIPVNKHAFTHWFKISIELLNKIKIYLEALLSVFSLITFFATTFNDTDEYKIYVILVSFAVIVPITASIGSIKLINMDKQ